jgi:hypothetical protein
MVEVKLDFNPITKEILRDLAFSLRPVVLLELEDKRLVGPCRFNASGQLMNGRFRPTPGFYDIVRINRTQSSADEKTICDTYWYSEMDFDDFDKRMMLLAGDAYGA